MLIPASAQPVAWRTDKAHSRVQFSVSHLVVSEVTGRFKDFDVTLQQANEDFTGSRIEAIIKTASIDTDNENRDKNLKSDDFLNAEKYPDIVFKSTAFEKSGKDAYTIKGDLTIRDITKPVVLDAKLNGMIEDGRKNPRAAFKATTSINRFEFGTKWNKTLDTGGLIAGETVVITLVMELVKAI
jgi:polyisoprenoid-binding protein YceI